MSQPELNQAKMQEFGGRPKRRHVRILGTVLATWGGLCLASGLALLIFQAPFLFVEFAHPFGDFRQGYSLLEIWERLGGNTRLSLILLLTQWPSVVIGIGLRRFRPWARVLGLLSSIVHLLAIPVGTILGGYGMWVLISRWPKEIGPARISRADGSSFDDTSATSVSRTRCYGVLAAFCLLAECLVAHRYLTIIPEFRAMEGLFLQDAFPSFVQATVALQALMIALGVGVIELGIRPRQRSAEAMTGKED